MIRLFSTLLSLSLVLTLISCTNSEFSGPPTITLTPNFGNADVGEEITTSVDVEAPNGFKSLTITTIVDEVRDDVNATVRPPQVPGQTGEIFQYRFTETTKELAAASVVDVEFLLRDDDDQTAIAFFRVGVNPPSILIAPEFSLNPPQSGVGGASTSTTFFTTSNEQSSWTIAQINSEMTDITGDIDFGYYYDATNNSAVLASIFDYPLVNFEGIDQWSQRNSTVFRKTDLTEAEFDAATFPEIYNAFEAGTAGTREQRSEDLAAGDVIAFETDSEKESQASERGLIFVHEIQAGDGASDFIRLTVKFEN